MATLRALLEKGYFPRELPPPFNTSHFAAFGAGFGGHWPTSWTRCSTHNLARAGGLRRPLKIPNPVSYFALASVVAAEWIQLVQHTWKNRVSASRPYIMKAGIRAVVPRYRYGELPRLRALRRRGNRYVLRTDISQFYPTLYTHAIPWALHTKAVCKAALLSPGKGKHLLGNKLDAALRQMNDGQTHGIPIGPDTSLVVAEVILAAVDEVLLQHGHRPIRGFRYVDDYELSFTTLREAEQALTDLQGAIAQYELVLNPRKTRIEELPKFLDDGWAIELKRFNIRDRGNPVPQRNDIVALFSRAFEIASERVEDSVLRYAVARVETLDVHPNGWHAFQNCVLGAAGAEASTLPVALGTLHQVSVLGGHTVAKSPLAELFENIIERHGPRGEGSEVAWALWGALAWGIGLSAAAGQSVSAMDDDIVALLALDADARGLFPAGSLDKQQWANVVAQSDVLQSEHWLLAYEANRQKWLTSLAIAGDPVFSAMENSSVSFYDRNQNSPQFPAGARGIPGGGLSDFYA